MLKKKRTIKKVVKALKKASKAHAGQAKMLKELSMARRDPKVGTGKKPKGSGKKETLYR